MPINPSEGLKQHEELSPRRIRGARMPINPSEGLKPMNPHNASPHAFARMPINPSEGLKLHVQDKFLTDISSTNADQPVRGIETAVPSG